MTPQTCIPNHLISPLSSSVGPLHSDRQYDITASKEGFVLSPVEGTQGDFKAFALAGVTFKVPVNTLLTCIHIISQQSPATFTSAALSHYFHPVDLKIEALCSHLLLSLIMWFEVSKI